MAAKVLTEAGAEVALLEADTMWDTENDSKMFAWPYDSPGEEPRRRRNLVGEWNSTRIIAKGPHVEPWLNGVKLLEYEL